MVQLVGCQSGTGEMGSKPTQPKSSVGDPGPIVLSICYNLTKIVENGGQKRTIHMALSSLEEKGARCKCKLRI